MDDAQYLIKDPLYTVNVILKLGFFIYFIILFVISVQKCFWKEGKNRVLLSVVSIVTSPLVTYTLSNVLVTWIERMLASGLDGHFLKFGIFNFVIEGFLIACFYICIIFLYARWIGKWLEVEIREQVVFLYMMFNTLSMLSLRGTRGNYLLDIAGGLVLFLASSFFYRLNVCVLAEMKDVHVRVDWKVFILPPAIFVFFFAVLESVMIGDVSFIREETAVTLYIFTTVIVFLFIWAFNIILKMIRVSDEAVMAKDEVKSLSVEVMEALAHTIDAKDEYTKGHSVRVAKYSRMIAEKMGLSAEECENTYYMGLLHDLGKIGVPNEIINSPTKLSDEQYDVIKTHPGLGFDILSEIKSRPDLVIGARWHHERYDGKGYPDGKSGEDIPLIARIIAVADSYDAMTSNRSYRNYLPQDTVRTELVKNKGTQFDPDVADVMVEIIDEDKEYVLHE